MKREGKNIEEEEAKIAEIEATIECWSTQDCGIDSLKTEFFKSCFSKFQLIQKLKKMTEFKKTLHILVDNTINSVFR